MFHPHYTNITTIAFPFLHHTLPIFWHTSLHYTTLSLLFFHYITASLLSVYYSPFSSTQSPCHFITPSLVFLYNTITLHFLQHNRATITPSCHHSAIPLLHHRHAFLLLYQSSIYPSYHQPVMIWFPRPYHPFTSLRHRKKTINYLLQRNQ